MVRAAKGRVVILVDNDVERDSRVQKQARSMADAGWTVTLLGTTPGKPRRWSLGDAEVRLVQVSQLLNTRPNDLRRARWRDPLAYPIGWLADTRAEAVRARQADLRVRRIAGDGGVGLAAARATTKVRQRWVGLRGRRTKALAERRRTGDTRLDRAATAFWQRVLGDRVWRRFDPHLWAFELALGPEVDALAPDLVHANDFRMVGVAARAAVRARERGRSLQVVWDVHEFLPGVRPWEDHPRWHLAQMAHESTYARAADAVVTVSEELATLLRERHGLTEQPSVVLNTPYAADARPDSSAPSIREACGVGEDTPIAVYSGAASPARGLEVMIEGLPRLPGLVVALVVNRPEADYVRGVLARAGELGVRDRVRVLPYVPFEQVVPFLSSADVGVIPILHWPNHEIQLITKFFEYSHARLPLVVSDVRVMAETTTANGQGEVFTVGDVDSYVAAVSRVLEDPKRYRAAYDDPALLAQWTWEAQAEILDAVYTRVLGRDGDAR